MNFYERHFPVESPPVGASYPCAVLVRDNWEDFGFHTLWGVIIYRSAGEKIMEGNVKILQRDPDKPTEARLATDIPSPFTALSDEYCSLGQAMKYYEALFGAGPDIYTPYLAALRDAAISPEVAEHFTGMQGFQKSLLRFSEAEKAFREAKSIFTPQLARSVQVFNNFSCYSLRFGLKPACL